VKGAQQAAFKEKKGVEQPIAGQHVGNPDRIGKYQCFLTLHWNTKLKRKVSTPRA
jgi:hypothetical protein